MDPVGGAQRRVLVDVADGAQEIDEVEAAALGTASVVEDRSTGLFKLMKA